MSKIYTGTSFKKEQKPVYDGSSTTSLRPGALVALNSETKIPADILPSTEGAENKNWSLIFGQSLTTYDDPASFSLYEFVFVYIQTTNDYIAVADHFYSNTLPSSYSYSQHIGFVGIVSSTSPLTVTFRGIYSIPLSSSPTQSFSNDIVYHDYNQTPFPLSTTPFSYSVYYDTEHQYYLKVGTAEIYWNNSFSTGHLTLYLEPEIIVTYTTTSLSIYEGPTPRFKIHYQKRELQSSSTDLLDDAPTILAFFKASQSVFTDVNSVPNALMIYFPGIQVLKDFYPYPTVSKTELLSFYTPTSNSGLFTVIERGSNQVNIGALSYTSMDEIDASYQPVFLGFNLNNENILLYPSDILTGLQLIAPNQNFVLICTMNNLSIGKFINRDLQVVTSCTDKPPVILVTKLLYSDSTHNLYLGVTRGPVEADYYLTYDGVDSLTTGPVFLYYSTVSNAPPDPGTCSRTYKLGYIDKDETLAMFYVNPDYW